MNRRDIVIGILLLSILAVIVFFVKKPKESVPEVAPVSTKEVIEERFKIVIPDDVETAELNDAQGGSSTAIATRKYDDTGFSHTVLADLPDPEEGYYEGWLAKGEDLVSTGMMKISKGGYILEYNSSVDYSDWNDIVITLEKISDSKPEEHVLEGSFK